MSKSTSREFWGREGEKFLIKEGLNEVEEEKMEKIKKEKEMENFFDNFWNSLNDKESEYSNNYLNKEKKFQMLEEAISLIKESCDPIDVDRKITEIAKKIYHYFIEIKEDNEGYRIGVLIKNTFENFEEIFRLTKTLPEEEIVNKFDRASFQKVVNDKEYIFLIHQMSRGDNPKKSDVLEELSSYENSSREVQIEKALQFSVVSKEKVTEEEIVGVLTNIFEMYKNGFSQRQVEEVQAIENFFGKKITSEFLKKEISEDAYKAIVEMTETLFNKSIGNFLYARNDEASESFFEQYFKIKDFFEQRGFVMSEEPNKELIDQEIDNYIKHSDFLQDDQDLLLGKKVETIRKIFGIEINFSNEQINTMYVSFFLTVLKKWGVDEESIKNFIDFTKKLKPSYKPSKEAVEEICENIIKTSSDPEFLLAIFEKHSEVKRTFSENTVLRKFWDCIRYIAQNPHRDFEKEIREFEELLGIERKFDEKNIHDLYDQIVESFNRDWYDAAELANRISTIESCTRIKPHLEEELLEKISNALSNCTLKSEKTWKGLDFLQRNYGIKRDFENQVDEVAEAYRYFLLNQNDDVLELKKNFELIQEVTGFEYQFSENEIKNAYDRFLHYDRDVDDFTALQEIVKVSPNKKQLELIFSKKLKSQNKEEMFKALKLIENNASQIDWNNVVENVLTDLVYDPKKIILLLRFVKQIDESENIGIKKLKQALKDNQWIVTLERLEKIQAISQNENKDAWKNELAPLLLVLKSNDVISFSKSEDAEILFEFVKAMGMVNLPKIVLIYLDCYRAQNFEDLSSKNTSRLEEYGIKLKKTNGEWRFPSPRSLVNEIVKGLNSFRQELLADKIPSGIESELGQELFTKIRGNTFWARNDGLSQLIRSWKDTLSKHPEQGKLPEGYQEEKYEVNLKEREDQTKGKEHIDIQETSKKLEILLSSKEVAEGYLPLAQALQSGIKNEFFSDEQNENIIKWWKELKSNLLQNLQKEFTEITLLLTGTEEQIDEFIKTTEDQKKKDSLQKIKKAMSNEKAKQNMDKQREELQIIIQKIQAIEYSSSQESEDVQKQKEHQEKELVRVMEELAILKSKFLDTTTVLRQISAQHLMFSLTQQQLQNIKQNYKENIAPTSDRVDALATYARQVIFEHYLHESQAADHTGHTPFSKELKRELDSAWQLKFDKQNRLMIEIINEKIKTIVNPEKQITKNTLEVSMVPAAGILKIFSGDIGDACYTSKHQEIARGDFPNLHAWIYVVNRGKNNESLKGSLLGIETEREDEVPALVARANNPVENFIQTVDEDAFTLSSLKKVVETAKRLREARVKENENLSAEKRKQCVVVPIDMAGRSSTNRVPVAGVYHKRYGQQDKVGLKNESITNFNNYPLWNKNGNSPCVTIWEIDENGKETWFGNWEEIK